MELTPEEGKPIQQRSTSRSYYCIARWCNNNNAISVMFRIPKGPRGKEWLQNAEREDLLNLKEEKLHRKYLCSAHFTPECFLKHNLLTWNAVPTLFSRPISSRTPVNNTTFLLPTTKIIIVQNGDINTTTVPSKGVQNTILTAITVLQNDSKAKHLVNKGVRTLKKNAKKVNTTCTKLKPVKKPLPQKRLETSLNTEIKDKSESDQMVLMEESIGFSLLNQEPVLSCGTCGEIFLVESGLAQHRLRYHSESSIKDN